MSLIRFGINIFKKPLVNQIKKHLQTYIEDFGEITDLDVNLGDRIVKGDIVLKGEKDTTQITIYDFDVLFTENKYFLTYGEIVLSKDWMKVLIDKYLPSLLPEKRLELPNMIGAILKKILK